MRNWLDESGMGPLHVMMDLKDTIRFATLTLAPAIDRTIELRGPLALDSVQYLHHESRIPGGKGLNAARVIASCGGCATAVGLIGSTTLTEFEEDCRVHGIIPRFIAVPADTRVNMMLTDGTRELKINAPAFPDLAFDPAWLPILIDALQENGTTHVIASGSLPPSFPQDLYATLTRELTARGMYVAVDTSGAPLREVAECHPWVLKPNRQEAEQLLGRPITDPPACVEAAHELATRCDYAILSDGANGAWVACHSDLWHVTPPTIKPVDTTAAGDTLLAYFCLHAARGRPTPETLALAVAAGAAATEVHGSAPPDPARVSHLAAQTTTHRIS